MKLKIHYTHPAAKRIGQRAIYIARDMIMSRMYIGTDTTIDWYTRLSEIESWMRVKVKA
jgi:hypothetical protein